MLVGEDHADGAVFHARHQPPAHIWRDGRHLPSNASWSYVSPGEDALENCFPRDGLELHQYPEGGSYPMSRHRPPTPARRACTSNSKASPCQYVAIFYIPHQPFDPLQTCLVVKRPCSQKSPNQPCMTLIKSLQSSTQSPDGRGLRVVEDYVEGSSCLSEPCGLYGFSDTPGF